MNMIQQHDESYPMDALQTTRATLTVERLIQIVVLVGFAAVLLLEAWLLVRVLFQ